MLQDHWMETNLELSLPPPAPPEAGKTSPSTRGAIPPCPPHLSIQSPIDFIPQTFSSVLVSHFPCWEEAAVVGVAEGRGSHVGFMHPP